MRSIEVKIGGRKNDGAELKAEPLPKVQISTALLTSQSQIYNGNRILRRWPPTKRNVRVIALRHVPLVSAPPFLTSHRVYVRNLEERINPDDLKVALTELFSEYGEIIDIVAKTNLKAKGQAFIVFDSIESAQKAIDEVQGFELFDKPMQLAFAKTRSDASVKRSGDDEEFESHKRRRLAEKGTVLCCYWEWGRLTKGQTRRRLLKLQRSRRD